MNLHTPSRNILICFLSFCLFSCKPGFDLVHLQAPPKQAEQIPRLQLAFDQQSFDNFYPVNYVEYEQIQEDGSLAYVNRARGNVQYQDVITIVERTLKHSMCGTKGEYFGTARLKVSSCNVLNRGSGLTTLSIFTVGLLNVVGMPHSISEAISEFELEILDSEGNVLRSYLGQGRATQTTGLYYGGGDAKRTVHAKAVNMALREIQEQVEKDVQMLKSAMKKAGPL